MNKRTILFKLTAGYTIIVLISLLTVSIIFAAYFRNELLASRMATMSERSEHIATLARDQILIAGEPEYVGMASQMLRELAGARVLICDAGGRIILDSALDHSGDDTASSQQAAAPLMERLLQGEEISGEIQWADESDYLLISGAPIMDNDGVIIGGVLLISPGSAMTATLDRASYMLGAAILLALALTALMSFLYARLFTGPLRSMQQAAMEMARGNYETRMELRQRDELGQLGDALDLLSIRLGYTIDQLIQEKNKLEDLVANVSHELRTPLTVIRGSTEALLDGAISEPADISRYQQRILNEIRGLERLVSDLMELNQLQSGQMLLHMEDLDVIPIIRDVLQALEPIASKKKIFLNDRLPETLPPIRGDHDRLRQLLIIFIDNAIRHSPGQSQVWIDADTGLQGILELKITDNGPGIPAEDLPFVWDRFYKADKSRQSSGGGTGLGLSIARTLAELQGGTVRLESILGKGTSAVIVFPTKISISHARS